MRKSAKVVFMLSSLAIAALVVACGGGGGGGAASTPTPGTLTVTTDSTGRTTQDNTLTVGGASFFIRQGTLLTDAAGSPVTPSVTMTASYSQAATDLPAAAQSGTPSGRALVGFMNVDLGGVRNFTPAATLTLPASGLATVDFYSHNGTAWVAEQAAVSVSGSTATVSVPHLSVWAAFRIVVTGSTGSSGGTGL